ncbi:MAG: Gfo/Idh/MocA family oxidoreductase [Terrimicrobiaceae bacterium]|nr:Gfo/Idh/MocA family oxidoreductase [Terrimicrobiaceae bacterium]
MSIGIGLIGAGRAGMIHGRNFAFRVPGAHVAAISDPDPATRQAAAAELGVTREVGDHRELLEDPGVDAVTIVTPTKLHREIALAAAAAGKHILCEKPMAMTVPECDDMIEAAERAGVKLQIGFMRRFDPAFYELKQRIEAGEIGDVVMVRSLTYGPSVPQPWMYDLRASNGPLAEVNSHDIDTVRWLTGSEITEIYAIGGNFRSPQARETFPDFYDNVSLVARFANGMQGMISGAQGVRYGYDARCEALGTKGILFAGSLQARAVTSCTEEGLCSPVIKSWRDLFADAYRSEDEEFVRCIRENLSPRVTGLDGKRAVQVVNAGNESIRTGKPVKL